MEIEESPQATMTAMIHGYPTEQELKQRIERQGSWRGESREFAIIWRGYLSGLYEWGLIELDVYERLIALLPKVGVKEQVELFADEPLSPEQEREVDENL
jgi:hypothetical protein